MDRPEECRVYKRNKTIKIIYIMMDCRLKNCNKHPFIRHAVCCDDNDNGTPPAKLNFHFRVPTATGFVKTIFSFDLHLSYCIHI